MTGSTDAVANKPQNKISHRDEKKKTVTLWRQEEARDSQSTLCPACACVKEGPNIHLAEGKVNGIVCTVMRDPGSVVSVVASYLVKPL